MPRNLDPSEEPAFRINPSTSFDVASVLRELSQTRPVRPSSEKFSPRVTVRLDLNQTKLAVQVLFDGEVQQPAISKRKSNRSLDNLFLNLLDDSGIWNEGSSCWEIVAGSDIDEILGLMPEFTDVRLTPEDSPFVLAPDSLDARLSVEWLDGGAELSMDWLLPSNGGTRAKSAPLVGTGPFWVKVDRTVYSVSEPAARIATLFPYKPNITLTRSQLAPLLEALQTELFDPRFVSVKNPQLEPRSEVADPSVVLELRNPQDPFEHFTTSRDFQLVARLSFEYPSPPPRSKVILLPNRVKELVVREKLTSLGFEYQPENQRYKLSEARSLEMLQIGRNAFPQEWRIEGLEQLQRGVRFARLKIKISVEPHDRMSAAPKGRIDWFQCRAGLFLNDAPVPISILFKNSLSETDRWIRLDNGAFAEVPGGSLSTLKAALGTLDPNFRLAHSIQNKISSAQAIGLHFMADSQIELSSNKELRRLVDKFSRFRGLEAAKPGKKFGGKLRPYQEEGLGWLTFLHEFGLGGILADEMGLGKTVQTLALLQLLAERSKRGKKRHRPSLIIAPTSVITNWWYEAQRFTPNLKALLLHGPRRRQFYSKLQEYDLLITSYALLRLDRQDLERAEWNYVVLDEAQSIKNYQAATTQAAKALNAEHRLALSGTPTENRPLELWSIMDFLMPGYLGSQEFFKNNVEKPILEGEAGTGVTRALQAKTKPFILRRIKAQVEQDLPPKVESLLHVEMTESQRELYTQILNEVRPRVLQAVEKRGVAGASVSILAALLRLRQVCNHPNSIEALRELPGYESGKFSLLKELLEEALGSGRKILLFGQFKEMLAIIRRHLEQTGQNYLYLDGATKNRQVLIDRFNRDEQVRLFLISLKAGGLGLNLTSADTVIIYDPWWNPAVENQAVDRAHRIGQKKTVHVYRLVTEDSIEQKIMDLKRKKARIVEALVGEGGASPLHLSKADVEQLFSPLPAIES